MKMIDQHNDILEIARQWVEDGREVVLATVVQTWGSSPRPCGSQLVVDEQGEFFGSVSGGCVEGAVISEARKIMKTRKPRLLEFSVSNEMAWDVGLACGGTVKIFLEPIIELQRRLLEKLNLARQQKQAVVLITNLDEYDKYIYSENQKNCIGTIPDGLKELARQASCLDRSQTHETEYGTLFFHVFNPTLRMLIIGAVHISQSLAPMATMCGYDVMIIDPRETFATKQRFPGIKINTTWPDKALEELAPDFRTAVVALTHDQKLDDPALAAALNSDAFYIGALGSLKTHAERQQRLIEQGFSLEQQQRICGPVGLDIGAQSTAEIALSIMAQVTQKARQG